MKTENDNDLKIHFAAQRRADHEQAPAWNPRWIQHKTKSSLSSASQWVILTSAAAACLILSFSFIKQPEPINLTAALPVLFDSSREPLFASLTDSSESPSDFLLPSYLTLQFP